jgi:hypothetical protein
MMITKETIKIKNKIEADYKEFANRKLWLLEEDKMIKNFQKLKIEDIIELNVGGVYFTTTKQTLQLSNSTKFLNVIENSRIDRAGRKFVDRPSKEFGN